MLFFSIFYSVSSSEEASTYTEVQVGLVEHLFYQAHDALKKYTDQDGWPRLFKRSKSRRMQQKCCCQIKHLVTPVGSEFIRAALQQHQRWLLGLYNHCLRKSSYSLALKQSLHFTYPKRERILSFPNLTADLFSSFSWKVDEQFVELILQSLWRALIWDVIDDTQFGFHKILSIVDELDKVLESMTKSKRSSKNTCLAALNSKI